VPNAVGLLSEEYDPVTGRMLGRVPQAFSHMPFTMAAHVMDEASARDLPPAAAVDAIRVVSRQPLRDRVGRQRALEELRLAVRVRIVLLAGDGRNDLVMLRWASRGVAMRGCPAARRPATSPSWRDCPRSPARPCSDSVARICRAAPALR
jgi:hypothetical protein